MAFPDDLTYPRKDALFKQWVWAALNYLIGPRGMMSAGPRWNDVRVPVTATRAGGSKDPTWTKWQDDGAGSQGVFLPLFAHNQEEELYFTAQMPHGLYPGTEIHPHMHIMPADNSAGTVRMGMEYVLVNPGAVGGNSALIYGERALNGDQDTHLIVGLDPDPAPAELLDSAQIVGRIFRDATHANDTYTGGIFLCEADFHVQFELLGSIQEYPI